jgi:hypothetical protein
MNLLSAGIYWALLLLPLLEAVKVLQQLLLFPLAAEAVLHCPLC